MEVLVHKVGPIYNFPQKFTIPYLTLQFFRGAEMMHFHTLLLNL